MLLALLFACNNTAPAPAAPPPSDAASSSVASALLELQSGQTPDPTPKDREPPAVPQEVADRAPAEPAASTGSRADSPECATARSERAAHEATINRYREGDVVAAEQRYIQSEAAFNWCLEDIGGCASDGEKVQRYQVGMGVAEKAMNDASFHVGELEAGLYDLDKTIQVACGTRRN